MIQNISIANKSYYFDLSIHHQSLKENIKQHHSFQMWWCFTCWLKQQINISKGSCDTKDWSNDAEYFSFDITGITF